jgi:transmembrane sensor
MAPCRQNENVKSPDPSRPTSIVALDESIREAARQWVVRRDRGLTPNEATEFERWRHADPRHEAALERSTTAWSMLDRLPAEVAVSATTAGTRRSWTWWRLGGLAAAAAALAVAYVGWWRPAHGNPAVLAAPATEVASLRTARLSDGTTVLLDDDSEVAERFTPTERRVLLLRGEALFDVAKNPTWPFVVRAGTVEIRAVGTAFNVRLQTGTVEVTVAEGQVRVEPDTAASRPASADERPLVHAGQRAVVALALPVSTPAVRISEMNSDEMTRVLARQEPLLRLGGSTLTELAAEFQRRTGRRVVLADPELANLRVGGLFRGDDLEGFVWLLEGNYNLKSERTADGGLVLRRAR